MSQFSRIPQSSSSNPFPHDILNLHIAISCLVISTLHMSALIQSSLICNLLDYKRKTKNNFAMDLTNRQVS